LITTERVRVCDVTLREGEQSIDAAFTADEKVEIAAALESVGVDLIQLGNPRSDRAVVEEVRRAGVQTPLELACVGFRANWEREVGAAIEARPNSIMVVIRCADSLLELSGTTRADVLERTQRSIALARTAGIRVAVGFSYATQAAPTFLLRLCQAAAEAGADRIVLADSLGRDTPKRVGAMVRRLARRLSTPIGIHCHDDFGLALASTLAGVEAGAKWAESSLGGIGERSGNVATEQLAAALELLYHRPSSVRLTRLHDATALVGRILRLPEAKSQPIVGEYAFASKLDVHVEGIARRPELFEPYPASAVGGNRLIKLGMGSGPQTLRAKLAELGLDVPAEAIRPLLERIHAEALLTKRAITDKALIEWATNPENKQGAPPQSAGETRSAPKHIGRSHEVDNGLSALPQMTDGGMRFGLVLAPVTDVGQVRELAIEAEELGFDYLCCGEHVLFHGPAFNSFVTLAVAAGATTRIGLLSGATVLPLYPAVLAAKMASLLDVLSHGRFHFGVGTGGEFAAEFVACGIPIRERRLRTEEALEVIRPLLAGRQVTFHGRFNHLDEVELDPPPLQSQVPIWIAGRKPTAMARAGRVGDVWFPYLYSAEKLAESMDAVESSAREAGRHRNEVTAAVLVHITAYRSAKKAREVAAEVLGAVYKQDFSQLVDRVLVAGDPELCRDRISAYRAAGARALIFRVACPPQDRAEMLQLLLTEVLPPFRSDRPAVGREVAGAKSPSLETD
jgi:probable F420-dependent oxidoreductase